MNPEEFYESRKVFFSNDLVKNNKKISKISLLRLLSLTAGIYFLVIAIRSDDLLFYPASLSFIILFLVLVVYHRNLNRLASLLKILVSVNENELKALKGEYSSFQDGAEFLDINHEFTYDLDIFGKKSLFQYINRCCTIEGKLQLAGKFTNSPLSLDKITRYQGIFKELSEEPEFMQKFLAVGMLADDSPGEKEEIISWMLKKSFVPGLISGILIYLIPIMNILIIMAGIYSTQWFNLLYLSIPVSWIFYGIHLKRINNYHIMISRKQEILRKYLDLNQIIAHKKFRNAELQKMSDECHHSINEFRKLGKLVNYLDSRMNILVGIVLNTIFLYDFHLIRNLEQWKVRNTGLGKTFFEIPAEFDSSISLAVYKFNNPGFCTPEIGNARLAAKAISHPLILQSKRVSNDFLAEEQNKLFIITGANMAGKSTFLRTLGVNMILAGMGAPVCAESMIFKPVKIITGMRTTDSLAESESYFFAELKRLQKITEKLESGESLFILLDEILKGTNSTDKHKGSVALVNKLVKLNCLALIATHDLSLGEEEKKYPGEISNLSFESYILNGELSFDYKLSNGIAKNMNAFFLMKKMGIV